MTLYQTFCFYFLAILVIYYRFESCRKKLNNQRIELIFVANVIVLPKNMGLHN